MATLTIINNTAPGEAVRLALYKKPQSQPDLQGVAWKVSAPPPSGESTVFTIPPAYEAHASSSFKPGEPDNAAAGNRTHSVTIDDHTARSSFYVAVVPPVVDKDARVADAETRETETEVLAGGTVVVTGSMQTGFKLQAL